MIPRVVHQVWLGGSDGLPEPPPHLAEASRSWPEHNPGWEHRIWSGPQVEALFRELRPDLLELYRGYRFWVQKADAARYLILWAHGGVYADFDVACVGSLEPWSGEDLVLAPTVPAGVSNDFMMARPGHPLFRAVLDALPDARRRWDRPWFPQWVRVMRGTASLHLSAVLDGLADPGPLRLLDPVEYGLADGGPPLVRHLTGNTWHRWDTRALVLAWEHRRGLAAAALLLACAVVASVLLGAAPAGAALLSAGGGP